MFEYVGRNPDPEAGLRKFLALVLAISGTLCSGILGLFGWLGWAAGKLLWYWMLLVWSWLFGTEAPLYPLELALVEVDATEVVVDDGSWLGDEWDYEPDPVLVAPELPPEPPPSPVRVAASDDWAVREELVLEKSMLLMKIIGTAGEGDAVVENLWADDDDAMAGLDMALNAGVIGVLSDASFDDDFEGVGGLGGAIAAGVDAEVGGQLGTLGRGGGGSGEGMGRIGGIADLDLGTVRGGVIGGVLPNHGAGPKQIKVVAPRMPQEAIDNGVDELVCHVRLHIDTRGRAAVANWVSCPELFHVSVRKAAEKSRWEPAFRDGQQVAETIDFTYRATAG